MPCSSNRTMVTLLAGVVIGLNGPSGWGAVLHRHGGMRPHLHVFIADESAGVIVSSSRYGHGRASGGGCQITDDAQVLLDFVIRSTSITLNERDQVQDQRALEVSRFTAVAIDLSGDRASRPFTSVDTTLQLRCDRGAAAVLDRSHALLI